MKLYLSGKITGNADYERDFATARARLEDAGYEVCNPAALGFSEDSPWVIAMRYVIGEMLRCDGVALLPGWEESKGACIEARLAKDLGMPTRPIEEWLRDRKAE